MNTARSTCILGAYRACEALSGEFIQGRAFIYLGKSPCFRVREEKVGRAFHSLSPQNLIALLVSFYPIIREVWHA